ncbi:unnamed protein product [Effrenium voratum]|nr:unnamed protein product [Effrenium voratum]
MAGSLLLAFVVGAAAKSLPEALESPWSKLAEGPWGAREGLMVASVKDQLILTGGRTTAGVGFASGKDVWRSADGSTWTKAPEAEWGGRSYHILIENDDGCIFLMGGQTFSTFFNDVWKSCDGADSWSLVTKQAAWPARAGLGGTLHKKKLFVAGGCHDDVKYDPGLFRKFYSDVWSSSDGEHWELVTSNPGWKGRSGPRLVSFKEDLYIIAGEVGFTTKTQLGDVWSSKDDGKTWAQLTPAPAFSARSGHGVVTVGDYLVLIAGWPELSDLYYSQDGKDWDEWALKMANVKPLPGPENELRKLLGDRLQTPLDIYYHKARGQSGMEDVAWNGPFRMTWNNDDVGFPSAIATVDSVEEVQAVVSYAGKHCHPNGTRLCVASGRHSHVCMLDDALVLDLQRISSVEVFPEQMLAKVGGGAQQGDLDLACEPHDLATTAGHNASTGCGGLILQGGHGFLERIFGLVVDNLLEIELVIANGQLIRASETENAELFWAVRGGGGNFGVAVSFSIRLHRLKADVYAGKRVHVPLGMGPFMSREAVAMHFFEKTLRGPDEATGLLVLPCSGPAVEILLWAGDPEEGRKYFEPKAKGWPVLENSMGIAKYHSQVQRYNHPGGDGTAVYQTGVLLPDISPEALEKVAECVSSKRAPNSSSVIIMLPLGGAVSRVATDATAYGFRDFKAWALVVGSFQAGDQEERSKVVKWVRDVKAELLPFSRGAGYGVLGEVAVHNKVPTEAPTSEEQKLNESEGGSIGIMLNTGQTGGRNIYGPNLQRLQAVKAKYDPKNLFNVNDNIVPSQPLDA